MSQILGLTLGRNLFKEAAMIFARCLHAMLRSSAQLKLRHHP